MVVAEDGETSRESNDGVANEIGTISVREPLNVVMTTPQIANTFDSSDTASADA